LCSSNVTVSFIDAQPITVSCPSNPVSYERVWTATDDCGNSATFSQQIVISDVSGPVFENVPTDACNDLSIPNTVTAFDECSGTNVNVQLSESSSDVEGCGQVLTRVWTATDACGNVSTATQQVFFTDDSAPVLTFAHPLLFALEDGGELTLDIGINSGTPMDPYTFDSAAVSVMDNCISTLTAVVNAGPVELSNCEETGYLSKQYISFTATDPCGNSSTIGFTLIYEDIYAPKIFDTPESLVLFCEDEIPAPGTVLVIDDYTQDIEAVFSEQVVSESFGTRIIRTWTAKDECGNVSMTIQHIDIYDNNLSCAIPISDMIECNSANNTLSVNVTGGQAPYTYAWDMTDCDGFITDGANSSMVTYTVGYTTQNFSVTITDANGCEQVCTTSLSCIKDTEQTGGFRPEHGDVATGMISIYPNPTSDHLMVKMANTTDAPVELSVVNLFGQVVYNIDHKVWPQEGLEIDTRQLPNGTYLVRIEQEGQAPISREFIVLH